MASLAQSSGTLEPGHLEAASSGLLREAVRTRPGNLVRLNPFFLAGIAERVARFLSDEACYRQEFRLFSSPDPVDEQRWAATDDRDRLSAVRRVAGAKAGRALGPGALAYLQLRQALEMRMRPFLELASGKYLGEAWDVGACRMEPGDFVRPHRYDPASCQLRLEVFLSRRWDIAFGGELCVIDNHERVTRIPAVFNSAVLLDAAVGNTYLVSPMRPEAGLAPRISVGVSFRPGASDGRAHVS
jgi:hypothetical protein